MGPPPAGSVEEVVLRPTPGLVHDTTGAGLQSAPLIKADLDQFAGTMSGSLGMVRASR